MSSEIQITTKSGGIKVDAELYKHLFESSIVSNHPDYLTSLKNGTITLSSLTNLCRTGHIAYSLFFGTKHKVAPMIDKESARLFEGFGGTYSVAVRGHTLNLNVVRLLIKDIKMKQRTITRFVKAKRHPFIKYLKSSKRSLEDQADCIVDMLGIDMDTYRSFRSKRAALGYLINSIEANNIFVSIENTGTNMPQNFKRAEGLTGVYVRHSKFPYFFIFKEGMASPNNLPARKAFTLIYLTVCLFKGQSKMVSLDQSLSQGGHANDELFTITELILMPSNLIPRQDSYTIDDLDSIADKLNVSPRATLTRLSHLGYIEKPESDRLKTLLAQRYQAFSAQQRKKIEKDLKGFRHNITNNIRIYQGKAYLRILRDQYSASKIKRGELNRQLSYGSKGSIDIDKVFKGL